MMYEKLKELIEFCESLNSTKLIEIVNEAGFVVSPGEMKFIEVVRVVNERVYVLFIDKDKMSDTYDEEGQVFFTWNDGKISQLDFVQKC